MAFADAQSTAVVFNEADFPTRVVLIGTVAKGDVIGYSSTGWKRALATVSNVVQGKLVAGQAGVSGDTITAFRRVLMSGARFTGGSPGVPIYTAESTDAGKYTETKPSTTNDSNNAIGFVLAADALVIDFTAPDSLAP